MAEIDENQCNRTFRKICNILKSEGFMLEQGMRMLGVICVAIAFEECWSQEIFDRTLKQFSEDYRMKLGSPILEKAMKDKSEKNMQAPKEVLEFLKAKGMSVTEAVFVLSNALILGTIMMDVNEEGFDELLRMLKEGHKKALTQIDSQ